MQLGQPTYDVGWSVLIAAFIRSPVLALRNPDIGGAIPQAFEADPGLGAGQRRAGAAVDAATEGEVLAGVLAFGVERVGIFEAAWVAIGGPVEHHQRAAGADGFVADGRRHPRQSEVTLDGALDSQAFLDEVREQATVLA